jgi:hypothetical protein
MPNGRLDAFVFPKSGLAGVLMPSQKAFTSQKSRVYRVSSLNRGMLFG